MKNENKPETEKLTIETEKILFKFSLYSRRRLCTMRSSVHNVDGRTPTLTRYICRRTS